jgi:hypothetical protein
MYIIELRYIYTYIYIASTYLQGRDRSDERGEPAGGAVLGGSAAAGGLAEAVNLVLQILCVRVRACVCACERERASHVCDSQRVRDSEWVSVRRWR